MNNSNFESLADYAKVEIQARILNGTYPPGSKLNSQEIANSLKISRTPVASAIDHLVLEGFAEKKSSRMTVVSQFKVAQIKEILQVREMIELYTVPLIIKNIPFYPEVVAKLEKITDELLEVENTDLEKANKLEDEFHTTFISLCNNSRIIKQYNENWSVGIMFIIYSKSCMPIYRIEETNRHHKTMLRAALSGDVERLTEAIKKHHTINKDTLDWLVENHGENFLNK